MRVAGFDFHALCFCVYLSQLVRWGGFLTQFVVILRRNENCNESKKRVYNKIRNPAREFCGAASILASSGGRTRYTNYLRPAAGVGENTGYFQAGFVFYYQNTTSLTERSLVSSGRDHGSTCLRRFQGVVVPRWTRVILIELRTTKSHHFVPPPMTAMFSNVVCPSWKRDREANDHPILQISHRNG